MRLGLTGGIGCGKSTAGKFFAEEGFRRVDVDAIVREEVLTQPSVVARIAERFGPGVLTAGGAVDRARLGERVFASREDLKWLEGTVHPEVNRRWQSLLESDPPADWVVEIPLLFERGLEKGFDFVACVACSEAIQIARLEQRGMARTLAGQRISQQMPLARKIELSSFVLSNDGSLAFLRRQVADLARTLRAQRT